MLRKRLRSLKFALPRTEENLLVRNYPKYFRDATSRIYNCSSSSCLPVAKIKCKHWTKTPTRPNAFTTSRMLSWPPPTKRCKRKRRLVGAENRWVSTSSANPSSPFCELVAHRPSLLGHRLKRSVCFSPHQDDGTHSGHCIRCAGRVPSSYNLSFLPHTNMK